MLIWCEYLKQLILKEKLAQKNITTDNWLLNYFLDQIFVWSKILKKTLLSNEGYSTKWHHQLRLQKLPANNVPHTIKVIEKCVAFDGFFFNTNIATKRLANGNIRRNTLYLKQKFKKNSTQITKTIDFGKI